MKPVALISLDWGIRCFGAEHAYDLPTRSLRVAEEAVELIQAYDIPKEKAHALVDMVYSRPMGNISQEIGGVINTLTVLCAALGKDTDEFLLDEVRRCLGKSPEQFHRRNLEKIQLGMKA